MNAEAFHALPIGMKPLDETGKERGRRIAMARELLALDQQDVADALGVSRGAVGNWELGKGVKLENVSKLASTLRVSTEWLLHGRGAGPSAEHTKPNRPPNNSDIDNIAKLATNKLPVYGSAVGGPWGEFIMDTVIGEIDCPAGCDDPSRLYAVRITGDTMVPRYEDGETVICDPQAICRAGDYVVARIRNETGADTVYIKRLVRRTTEELVLSQLNPPKEIRFEGTAVSGVHAVLWSGSWR